MQKWSEVPECEYCAKQRVCDRFGDRDLCSILVAPTSAGKRARHGAPFSTSYSQSRRFRRYAKEPWKIVMMPLGSVELVVLQDLLIYSVYVCVLFSFRCIRLFSYSLLLRFNLVLLLAVIYFSITPISINFLQFHLILLD